jgi:hypothetical protein
MENLNYYIMKKKDLVSMLKTNKLKSSFPKKTDLISYLKQIQWSLSFPWRETQQEIIHHFIQDSFQIIALQGLFGCGKTTMLLGMLNIGYWKNKFKLDDICFCAFNVCIKNEIRKKIQGWSMKEKPMVRTFDSIIYELCAFYEYPHLKKPNYEGKRKFIIEVCKRKEREPFTKYDNIRYLFVDEAQDLEKSCFMVFETFFKNAKMVFVGDIFQSIQKEPRESLLWWITHQNQFPISYFYMKDTPRVPQKIFGDIKSALTKFYPEYQDQIQEWKSLNHSSNHGIEWNAYENYKELYQKMFEFIDNHDYSKSMILTFSSCITVRGSLGDLARIRQMIEYKRNDIPINSNYKQLKDNALFLSTANSSKGLERDYVFIVSTFPLEKAFINFSKDLTMNLITVAISRAKTKAIVCVPKMTERYSTAFYSYPSSPKPEYTFFPSNEMATINDFIQMEHCVTDILRQSVIKYDTRIHYQSNVKKTIKKLCFPENIFYHTSLPKSILKTEEQRAFVGVCIEVLMTSTWKKYLPETPSILEIEFNPMYSHCIQQIKKMRLDYHKMKKMHMPLFDCVFLYSQLFMAIHNKIFFHFKVEQKYSLKAYWDTIKSYIQNICPNDISNFKVQQNIKMMNITGIIDGVMTVNNRKHIYEIKASIKSDWKEDAFIQAFIYAIQLGQTWFHLHLVNLFKNEYIEYIVYIENGVRWARSLLFHDTIIWNMNSFLAKCHSHYRNLEECLFIHHENNETVCLSMSSPTRIILEFYSIDQEETNKYFQTHEIQQKVIRLYDDINFNIPFQTYHYTKYFSHISVDLNDKDTDILTQTVLLMVKLITEEF